MPSRQHHVPLSSNCQSSPPHDHGRPSTPEALKTPLIDARHCPPPTSPCACGASAAAWSRRCPPPARAATCHGKPLDLKPRTLWRLEPP
jgi:hypothetical protein